MRLDQSAVASAIQAALLAEMDFDEVTAQDIAFHMTDWLDDLDVYAEFCQSPGLLAPEQVTALLMKFVAQVPSHLAAAHKLLMDLPVTDVFGIDAVSPELPPDA